MNSEEMCIRDSHGRIVADHSGITVYGFGIADGKMGTVRKSGELGRGHSGILLKYAVKGSDIGKSAA